MNPVTVLIEKKSKSELPGARLLDAVETYQENARERQHRHQRAPFPGHGLGRLGRFDHWLAVDVAMLLRNARPNSYLGMSR